VSSRPIARRIVVTGVALALPLAVASACGGNDGGNEPSSAPTSAPPTVAAERPTSTAHLTIASPENGERVAGDVAHLEIELHGAEVVDQTSTDLQPDRGHLHVMLDGELVSMTSGASQLLTDLTAGEHLVQVEFVATDHAPFDPRVLAAVTFEVKG
jgi:hypothetical protein